MFGKMLEELDVGNTENTEGDPCPYIFLTFSYLSTTEVDYGASNAEPSIRKLIPSPPS
jgi:hypothetical protein